VQASPDPHVPCARGHPAAGPAEPLEVWRVRGLLRRAVAWGHAVRRSDTGDADAGRSDFR